MIELLDRPPLTLPVGDRDHVVGPETAAVTLLEYGDYECPFCAAAHPIVQELRQGVGETVRFAYRHFPLSKIHPHAAAAAEAAEAAGAQGRFWEMHELLFANQHRLGTRDLLAYGETLGLDMERFADDLAAHTFASRVREDFTSGIRSGVNGTPTFFVNGVRHNSGYDLQSLLAAALAAA